MVFRVLRHFLKAAALLITPGRCASSHPLVLAESLSTHDKSVAFWLLAIRESNSRNTLEEKVPSEMPAMLAAVSTALPGALVKDHFPTAFSAADRPKGSETESAQLSAFSGAERITIS